MSGGIRLSQQNIHPLKPTEEMQIEHKIILLYLIHKMDIPISNSQIVQFALSQNYMNFYNVQQYLIDMVNIEYLDESRFNNTTRYIITDQGIKALDTFSKYLSNNMRYKINNYVSINLKNVKRDFEVVANHFYEQSTNEYFVKLGVYDDDIMLMELNISVVSREQALLACNNWKENVDKLYANIIDELLVMKSK